MGLTFFKGPFSGAYFWRGLSKEGNLRFKIDWASLIVGSKFIVFALFYFVFEGNFPSTSPRGAYIWRGLFSEFYSSLSHRPYLTRVTNVCEEAPRFLYLVPSGLKN